MQCVRVVIGLLLFARFESASCVMQAQPSPSGSGTVAVVALSPPVYPPMARVANIWGDVSMVVKIRPDGTIESVAPKSGHPILVQAAVDSARQTRFQCRGCSTGALSYPMLYTLRIVAERDCCRAMNVPPRVEQVSRTAGLDDDWQTRVIITAEQFCTCDPAIATTKRTRSLKCLYLWKCSRH